MSSRASSSGPMGTWCPEDGCERDDCEQVELEVGAWRTAHDDPNAHEEQCDDPPDEFLEWLEDYKHGTATADSQEGQ